MYYSVLYCCHIISWPRQLIREGLVVPEGQSASLSRQASMTADRYGDWSNELRPHNAANRQQTWKLHAVLETSKPALIDIFPPLSPHIPNLSKSCFEMGIRYSNTGAYVARSHKTTAAARWWCTPSSQDWRQRQVQLLNLRSTKVRSRTARSGFDLVTPLQRMCFNHSSCPSTLPPSNKPKPNLEQNSTAYKFIFHLTWKIWKLSKSRFFFFA